MYSECTLCTVKDCPRPGRLQLKPEPLGLCQSVVTSSIGHSGTWGPSPEWKQPECLSSEWRQVNSEQKPFCELWSSETDVWCVMVNGRFANTKGPEGGELLIFRDIPTFLSYWKNWKHQDGLRNFVLKARLKHDVPSCIIDNFQQGQISCM